MHPIQTIIPPAAEPVTLGEFKQLIRWPSSDTSRDIIFNRYLKAARANCESETRTRLVTQTVLERRDSFPGVSVRYNRNGYPAWALPCPPFQSVQFVQYVDTGANVDPLLRDATYGAVMPSFYAYQLERGGGITPAYLFPAWARPWPPQLMVPANTLAQFRCGYGGPLTVSMTQGSAQLAVSNPAFTFNADDAPQLVGETGTKISIPGAGVSGGVLRTTIASVASGVATLASPAVAAVANVQAWLGDEVPSDLCLSILFEAQYFNEQGAVMSTGRPEVIGNLRSYHTNYVS
jgi:hypothetical protein